MYAQGPNQLDRLVGTLADGEHGVVSRQQLLDAGLSRTQIAHRISAGRLRRLHRGVYAVGHVALSREGWWKAALLACGEHAALSHRSAATHWDVMRPESIHPIDVLVPGDRGRKHDAIVVHRSQVHPDDVVSRDGLRVTTPARTLVDLASELAPRPMRTAVERSQDARRFQPDEIRAVIARTPRRIGSRRLVDLLDLPQPDDDNARSHLERLFLRLVRKTGLPRPEVNSTIAGHCRDFVWPEERLVVETDGYRWHSSKQAMRRDRRRDRELLARGWRPARFTYEEIAFEPGKVGRELRVLLDR